MIANNLSLNKLQIVVSMYLIFFFTISIHNLTATENEIKIDNLNHQLLAPRGSDYQWYFNNELLSGLHQREIRSVKSGEYKVIYTDESGQKTVESIVIAVQQGIIHKIYVIGDSTVATYNDSYYPQKGWGQVLQLFFNNSQIQVVNRAIGGRSSRSFYEEGRWTEVLNSLATGDYVFIQFGHNDRDWTKPERYTDTAAYKNYLRIYVNDSRSKGAIPVLVSPMIMHAYNGTTLRNVFTEGANDYRGSMLKVAQELDVPFVDLNMKSFNRVKEVGKEYASYFLYLGLLAGEYPNFPNGSSDGTHFQEMGALEMARLITDGLKEINNDTNITKLNNALAPLYNVQASMNLPDAGIVSRSGEYPAGSTITLKTRLKNGFSFSKWEDDLQQPVSTSQLYTFTVNACDYSFKANIKDCKGEEGGSARIDNCGYCSGGNTGIFVCKSQFQSENACIFDGAIESDTTQRTYIITETNQNGGFSYMLNASYDTTFQMGIIFKSVNAGENINIYIDDEMKSSLPIMAINVWDTIFFQLELLKGSHKVRIETDQESGGVFFDNLITATAGLQKGNCNPLELKDNRLQQISYYPNPFQGVLFVSGNDRFEFRILSSSGIELEKGVCTNNCEIGSHLEKGIYLLQIIRNNESTALLVQKK